jgi:uncharacterized Zn finger protein
MSYDYGFPKYVSVAEKRLQAQKSLESLKKKNPNIHPITIDGTKIVNTWWGKAWNDNLERYSDYANRIGRGRSYLRHGAVLDLQITSGEICALVQGSSSKPYKIKILIKPIANDVWEKLTKVCEGKLDSLQELIAGKFPKALADLFTAQGEGLFPAPHEIVLDCNCPDWAEMCKHVAAALYGVGVRLDNDPTLFFVLRKINIDELISKAIIQKSQTLLKKSKTKSSRVIEDADISAMFGIEMETEPLKPVNKPIAKKITRKKKVAKTRTKKMD